MELRSIDFRTSHNIVLSFPLASLQQRILAFVIDFVIVTICFLFFRTIFGGNESMSIVFATIFYFLYHLSLEIFNMGQSFGKKILKIRVVSLDGKTPSLNSYLIRWAFRMIDIGISLGSLAVFSTYSSSKGQRIGDLLAGTTVVQTKLDSLDLLKEIESLNLRKKDVIYPEITMYNDEQMLMVKNMLTRYRKKNSHENFNLMNEMADRIRRDIDPTIKDKNSYSFLERALSDYIILTR